MTRRYHSYKDLLTEMEKTQDVILTISIWVYGKPKRTVRAHLRDVRPFLSKELIINPGKRDLQFKTLDVRTVNIPAARIHIAKVDYVTFHEKDSQQRRQLP